MIQILKNIVRRIPGAEELHYLATNFGDRVDYRQVPSIPASVMIELNNTCNLHCKMCGTKSARRKKGNMDISDYRRVIEEVSQLGIRNVTLYTHGEPLLYPNLPDVVRIAKEKNLTVSISTNGNLLSEELGRELLSAGLDVLRYSVEGASKLSYEKIRIGGNFNRLFSNMQQFKKLRDRHRSRTAIHLNTVVMAETEHELESFIRLYSPIVDSMHFGLLSNQAGSYRKFDFSSIKSVSNNKKSPCSLLWKTFIVNWDLTASACCIDFHGELQVGNLREESLQEVWLGERYQHFRDLHQRGLYGEMPLCGKCNKNLISKFERFSFDRSIHRKYRKSFQFSRPFQKSLESIDFEQNIDGDSCLRKDS